MEELEKKSMLDNTDKKLHISDVIDCNILKGFYIDYDNWCRNLWDGQFYVKWLKRDVFFGSIKTYSDWNDLQKDVGLLDDDRTM